MAELIDVVTKELHTKKVAALADTGLSARQIAEETHLSIWQVKRIMASDEFKLTLRDMADKAVADVAAKWRLQVSKLLPKMLKVIENRLEKDDLEAVKVGLKSLGIGSEEKVQGDTSISILLPGSPPVAPTDVLTSAREIPQNATTGSLERPEGIPEATEDPEMTVNPPGDSL